MQSALTEETTQISNEYMTFNKQTNKQKSMLQIPYDSANPKVAIC